MSERELSEPLDAADLYTPSVYIKAAFLRGKDCTWKLVGVSRREVVKKKKGEPDKTVIEGLLEFDTGEEDGRRNPHILALNVTNRKAFEAMFGERQIQKTWVGKWATLTTGKARNPGTGKTEPCVRVRGSPDIDGGLEYGVTKLVNGSPIVTTHKLIKTESPKGANVAPERNPEQVAGYQKLLAEAIDAKAVDDIAAAAKQAEWHPLDKREVGAAFKQRREELSTDDDFAA